MDELYATLRGGLPGGTLDAVPYRGGMNKVFSGKFLQGLLKSLRRAGCQLTCQAPKYEPQKWNDPWPGSNPDYVCCQGQSNCYSYACNKHTYPTPAQPGYSKGTFTAPADCQGISARAVLDGLVAIPTGVHPAIPVGSCTYLAALCVTPSNVIVRDYHWYRKDDNGRWSHKVGPGPVSDVDNAGNLITDPQTADRGPYTVFCGFFTIDPCAITIAGPEPGEWW
jgi:hypothetical protein